jgi:hypothetical protein
MSLNTPDTQKNKKGLSDYFGQKRQSPEGYSKSVSQLSEGQKTNLRVNPKNPLTIIKPLRPNILDQMAIDNVNWLASQRRRAGTKWVRVQQL